MKIDISKLPNGAITQIAEKTGLHQLTISRFFKGTNKRIRPNNEVKILEALEQILTEQKERTDQAKERIQALLQ